MLEFLNSAACAVLMLCTMPVATLMSNRGFWAQRLSLAVVDFALFLQVVNPWVGWVPSPVWSCVSLHVASAGMVLAWWPEVWLFVRTKFEPVESDAPKRRVSDFAPLNENDFGHVRGGHQE